MKKVAVCICGFVRNYEKYYQSLFEHLINFNKTNFEFDFFISTWIQRNSKNTRSYEKRGIIDLSDVDITSIKTIFNPKSILVENFNDDLFSKYKNYGGQNNYKSIFSQFYKVKQVSTLLDDYIKSSGITYELVIRTRFDLKFTTPINLSIINPSLFYIDKEDHGIPKMISDKFSISGYEVFKIYSIFFSRLRQLIMRLKDNVPEQLLYLHMCEDNNIRYVEIQNLYFCLYT